MFAVRFHGCGGQGVVAAAELLASAALREGRYAQASASSGPERTGAPVMSSCWIDDKPIRTHEPVTDPDALLILDPMLTDHPGDPDGARGNLGCRHGKARNARTVPGIPGSCAQAGPTRRPVMRDGTIRTNSSRGPGAQGSTPALRTASSPVPVTWCAGPWMSTLQPR